MKTIVVNLFGVPGSGKSTGAAYIFAMLKMAGVNAELITEFAKDKVWEENKTAIESQTYLFGKQSYRMFRCANKVEVIVTDSPLPLSILYNTDAALTESFNQTVMDVFNSYENANYLLKRVKPYNPSGRLQTEHEADELESPLKNLLDTRSISYTCVDGYKDGYDTIVNGVYRMIKSREEKPRKTLTAIQATKHLADLCLNHSCLNCPINNLPGKCEDSRFQFPEEVLQIVTEWAVKTGAVTEDLEDIDLL